MRNLDHQEVKLAFSGTAADSGRLALPRAMIPKIMLHVAYTVTDSGISAGEIFQGAVQSLRVGEGQNLPLYLERNELQTLINYQTAGISTGKFIDAVPTTATLANAFYEFTGPFDLREMSNPSLVLDLRTITDEWGAASDFTATVRTSLEIDNSLDKGVYYHREYRPSSTLHELSLGPGHLSSIFLSMGGSNVDKWTLETSPGEVLEGSDHPQRELEYYASLKTGAVVAGQYLIQPLDMPYNASRRLVVDCATTGAATCLGISENIL